MDSDKLWLERKIQKYIKNPINTNSRVDSLNKYLDDLEEKSIKNESIVFSANASNIKLNENSISSNLSNRIFDLESQLQKAANTIEFLNSSLSSQKSQIEKELEKSNLENEITKKKVSELESAVERNLTFIDQLITDKKELSEENSKIISHLKDTDKKSIDKVKEIKEIHRSELRNAKEAWMAAEKLRRDKWCKDKTEEIRASLMKSIEPEIQKVLANHSEELRKEREALKIEYHNSEDKMKNDFEKKVKELKDKYFNEYQNDVDLEREKFIQKLKENSDKYEKLLEKEKTGVREAMADENQRLKEEIIKKEKEFIIKLEERTQEYNEELKVMRTKFEQQNLRIQTKNEKEIERLELQMKIQKEEWLNEQKSRLKEELDSNLAKMKKDCERERDEQIEHIINKFVEERESSDLDIINSYEQKLRKTKEEINVDYRKSREENKVLVLKIDDLQNEIKLLNQTNDTIANDFLKLKTEYSILENELTNANVEAKRCLMRAKEADKLIEEKECDFKRMRDIEISKYKDEIIQLNTSLTRLQIENENLLTRIQESHNQTLEELESKVRKIINKKDQENQDLLEELQMKDELVRKYQEMLERQRKDLMEN